MKFFDFGKKLQDRPVFVQYQDGAIDILKLQSRGKISINDQKIHWQGSRSQSENEKFRAILYNSANSKIIHKNNVKGQRFRTVDEEKSRTPKIENESKQADLIIALKEEGKLIIQEINEKGETLFTKGNFILRVQDKGNFKVGDEVVLDEIDGIPFEKIKSAVTLFADLGDFQGKNEQEIGQMEINNDPSLVSPNFLAHNRYQRTVIGIDKEGKIKIFIFDGAPKTENFKGISVEECLDYFQNQEFKSGPFFCDGGQSSRMVFRLGEQDIHSIGSFHYLNKKGSGKKTPLLTGARTGRLMPSCFVVRD